MNESCECTKIEGRAGFLGDKGIWSFNSRSNRYFCN